MTAQLNSGIKSIHLVIPTPYDLIRTTDVRDDLVAVKVWYSDINGFDPAAGQGTLFSEANSLSVTITGLETNKVYYVRYALISAIDPATYTISPQYSAMTYDENTSFYGYLTNDPTALATESDGSGGNWAVTAGVFKVYNYSQDVTGAHDLVNGPFYSIKANSTIGGLVATIDPVTGAYSATGMDSAANSASVIFRAVYKDMVVEKVWNVYKGKAGQLAPTIQLTATTKEFIYKDVSQKRSITASTTITATLKNLTGTPTFETRAFSRAGDELGAQFGSQQIAYTQNGNSITITNDQFSNPLDYNVDLGYVTVTARIGDIFDSMSIYRINDGSTQIQVEQSNQAHTITAAEDGGTDPLNYVGSGNIITVKRGAQSLVVDTDAPYAADTWRIIDIVSTNITCDPTPNAQNGATFIEFDQHSAMTADVAYIDYKIRVQITGSNEGNAYQDFPIRQSFSKSKQGVQGSTAKAVNLTTSAMAFITHQGSTTPSESSVTLIATPSNYTGGATYTWLVDGVAPTAQVGTATGNTFTLNAFPSGTSKTVKVTVSENAISSFDVMTIYSLREGSDAVVAGIQNESRNIVCDSLGEPAQGQLPFSTTLFVVRGSQILNDQAGQVTFAKVSYSGGNSASYSISPLGVITINSLNVDYAEAKFTATVGDLVLTKTLYITKTKDGKTPVKGVDYNDGTSIKVQYSMNASSWHDTYVGGDVFIRVGTVLANGSTTWSAAQKYIPEKGVEYFDGTSAYLHIKYSDDGISHTFTANNGEVPGTYMGTYSDSNPSDSNDPTLYTWVKIKGDDSNVPGPRNASGFLFYKTATTSQPSGPTPTPSSYNFTTNTFGSLDTNWGYTPPAPTSNQKSYAVRYSVTEATYGGTQTVTISAVFINTNFDGLVTFTNVSDAVASNAAANGYLTPYTTINGSNITTGTIDVARLNIAQNSATPTRMTISSDKLVVYSNNVARVIIGNLG